MSEICPVVQIADSKAPGGFVEINESDYDPKIHKLFTGNQPKEETKAKVKQDKAEK